MLKGFLMVLSGYLGKWVYEFFSGRRAKSQSLVTYIFPGLFALVWCFIAIVGFLGLFLDLGGSTRDAALMFGGCVAVAVVLWLACLPLRIAEKKKVAEKEAEEQAEIQRQAEYREENGVAPLLCDVDGYVECPQCHTRQKLGREKCFGCDVLFKSTPIKQQPTETAEKAGAERVPHDTNGESENVGPVPTPRPLFCRKCGAKLQTDSLFCGACGAEIIRTEQDPSQDEMI